MTGVAASADLRPQEWYEVTAPPAALAHAAGTLAAGHGAGTLAPGVLGRLVEELAARKDLWEPLVISDRRRRRYRLLYEDPRLDVWVLSWMPGQSTGFHDHGASSVALAALQGSVLERQMRLGLADVERVLAPGRFQSAPGGYIHSVAHAAGQPAVTLHAYSPPLVDVGQYRAGRDGELLRERQHGRQELLDNTLVSE
jgi:predicted metal-dependent enzyme (double-stranded beta helix superfamily)